MHKQHPHVDATALQVGNVFLEDLGDGIFYALVGLVGKLRGLRVGGSLGI